MEKIDQFISRAEGLVERIEGVLNSDRGGVSWDYVAFRWRGARGLKGVARPHLVDLGDLLCMERQKGELVRNTRQFVEGRGANNVLLSGSRGTGKSSLIKGLLHTFAPQGLRLIEVERDQLGDLPDIVDLIAGREERFILYCDDLSFEADDPSYKSFKATLDGSISAPPENCLIYATSNRRHLLPEYQRENQEARMVDGELHHGEAVEEKVSLSERFGLWLSFYPFSQEQYLQICDHWLGRFGAEPTGRDPDTRRAALQWATQRGSRSGRVAWQFARDWSGRVAVGE